MIIHTDTFIAGIQITFWLDHPSDTECLDEIFLYHTKKVCHAEKYHDVIIASSKDGLNLPAGQPLAWQGHINGNVPVQWYNNVNGCENIISIGKDILIKHLPQRKLTICYLSETKAKFFKSRRPRLVNYIFFLLHSITSMHGKYCIHASCAAKDGHACLFLGKSGEGKSTISAILGNAGWEYMGDDLVFMSQVENGEIIIDGFLSKIKLLNAKLELKNAIDVIKDKKFRYTYRQKLGAIIKLQQTRASKKSILLPASQAEAFAWLMNSSNNIKIQYHPQQWINVCEKASALPAYTLMFADKEYFNPAILDAILQ
jgi:hypothetical protein